MIVRHANVIPLALLALALAGPANAANATPDDTIRAVEARQEAAWNTHDAHAYAALFTTDGEVVNVLGWWWKSRSEIESKLGQAFAFVFAHSTLHITDVAVRPVSPDMAIAHVTWLMTGALSPDGSGANVPQHGIQTQVLVKHDGSWMIAAVQNTNAIPERPFPQGPGHTPPH